MCLEDRREPSIEVWSSKKFSYISSKSLRNGPDRFVLDPRVSTPPSGLSLLVYTCSDFD